MLPIVFIWGKSTIKTNLEVNQEPQCDRTKELNFTNNKNQLLKRDVSDDQSLCYQFYVQSKQQLSIDSNTQVKLQSPGNTISVLQGKKDLTQSGEYLLIIHNSKNFEVNLDIKDTTNLLTKNNVVFPLAKAKNEQYTTSYKENDLFRKPVNNQTNTPPFKSDDKLQNIVDDIVTVARQRGLRTDKLSISLVDLNSTEYQGYAYASFADYQPRYPASVVKLFWMVVLFGQYEQGILPSGKISEKTLVDLIKDSDNEAGSLILDTITKTQSGSSLPLETMKAWKAKRDTVNLFFEQAGYKNINISQKTYPIPYLRMNLPAGRDKQLRDKNLVLRNKEINPIRNYLTTDSVARLLYEIYSNQSVSDFYSNEMKTLLKRDLNPAAWRNKPYNAIKGFLGEGLPPNTDFYSKMGWTFNNRNDTAIIVSPDGKVRYILVIFGDDKSFYQDKDFLPEVSRLVYQQMTNY
ncbi:MAG: serine hydrolase [Xenococcaceae cyanobacterium MO_167.B27]|nr:serine hydrolase [Xenococcaceae cyanobacterium MO_167.B27]